MSEYQYVAFRAVDRPVSGDDLKYMESQSSRAKITPWSFDNEYNFGDFHGKALEMLRRGYDIHLHYANYGTHRLMIRLPNGLPDAAAIKPYLIASAITFDKDKSGPGGSLSIDPFYEPGDIEETWDIGPLADRLAPIRAEILDGDLRPLYLAHLAASSDSNHDPETTREAPVPAGLDQLTSAQLALAEFYGLGDSLIAAAARQSPPLPKRDDPTGDQRQWLAKLPAAKKDEWLAAWMADAHSLVRATMLAEFRKSSGDTGWPTAKANRTISELFAIADSIKQENARQAAQAAAKKRAERLAKIKADPKPFIAETNKLATEHSSDSYRRIGEILAELREALAGGKQADLAAKQAKKLHTAHPTLNRLKSALRKQGFEV